MKKRGKKQANNKDILYIFARYLILVVLGVFISVFYKIFLPLTIWPVYLLLKLFYGLTIYGSMLDIAGVKIEIINACVAGSAYYLLLILNLTTKMKVNQRVFSIFFSFLALLFLNIIRIFVLSVFYLENFSFFDITHKIFWYALSVLFVVGIWFLTVKIFKIKEVPIYSDIKKLVKNIKR